MKLDFVGDTPHLVEQWDCLVSTIITLAHSLVVSCRHPKLQRGSLGWAKADLLQSCQLWWHCCWLQFHDLFYPSSPPLFSLAHAHTHTKAAETEEKQQYKHTREVSRLHPFLHEKKVRNGDVGSFVKKKRELSIFSFSYGNRDPFCSEVLQGLRRIFGRRREKWKKKFGADVRG